MAGTLTKALARSCKAVGRLLLFLPEVVSLFQGQLVILSRFPKTEFQVKSLGKAARHRQWELLLLTLGHGKSPLILQSTVTSDNFFLTVLGITFFFPFLNHLTFMSVNF